MKIIHFTSHIGHGGDWSFIKSLADIFIKNNHKVLICGSGTSNIFYNSMEIPLNKGLKGFIYSLFKIYQLPNNTDIAHVHNPISLVYVIFYKYLRCRRLKIVFTYHLITPSSNFKKLFKIILFRFSDIVHSCSEEIILFLKREYKITSSKSLLIYPGINSQKFNSFPEEKKNELKKKYNVDKSSLILLFAGRLAPEKNIPLILEYLANTSKYSSIVLMIAGDGDLKQELQQQSLSLNIENKVIFLGRVEKIEEIYAIADLLILPSSMETFGLVVIEAAFCGLPTLRSDVPGAKDQIVHGKNGFIFSAKQPETMFETLDLILSESFKLSEIGKKARSDAMCKFTNEKMYNNFLNLYEKILEGK